MIYGLVQIQRMRILQVVGAEIPFIRPEELSLDDSSSGDVILHAMAHAKKINKKYDYIGMLEPTSHSLPQIN